MRFSSPSFYSALGACFLHSLALGFAATLMVTAPQPLRLPVKVRLVQSAVPLPIGEGKSFSSPSPAPAEQPQPAAVLTQKMQPHVEPKAQRPPAQSRAAKVKKIPAPQLQKVAPPVETALTLPPQETSTQMAAVDPFSLNGTNTVEAVSASSVAENQGHGRSSGAGGPGGETGRGLGGGGRKGNTARPDYRVNPKPPYPMVARHFGAQGVVLLRVQVREDGSVADVEMAQSSGFSFLDESATRTVRESWQFLPARIEDGTPIASWVEVPIRFVLEDS